MKKYIIGLLFVILVTLNSYASQPQTYKTSEEFLKAEGKTCKIATDGCNKVWIEDSKLGMTTLMSCVDKNGNPKAEEWSCLDNKLLDEKLSNLSQDEKDYYVKSQKFLGEDTSEKIEKIINDFGSKILEIKNYNIENSSKIIDIAISKFENAQKNLGNTKQDYTKSEIINLAKLELKIMKYRWIKSTILD